MIISPRSETSSRVGFRATWITVRRIRAHALILAVCLWGVAALDFATPGLMDRAGNVKFQDFLPLYVSARMVTEHRAAELYDPHTTDQQLRGIVQRSTKLRLPYLYGPQIALFFSPLARFSFSTAARIWVALSLLIFFGCIFLIWNRCPALREYPGTVLLAAIAFPPLFHFFMRGQISVLPLACFVLALVSFERGQDLMADIALGCLVFKPQFLIAIPLVLLLARAWKPLLALILSAVAQLLLTWLYFGSATMRAYFGMLLHPADWIGSAELALAPTQMHSLRSFWTLLIPWPAAAFAFYVAGSIATIILAAAVWRSSDHVAVRFSALTLAAVLVNPHLFVYDLLVLAPVLLVLAGWYLSNVEHPSPAMPLFLYLAFLLPLVGPLSRWTHVQLSVVVFAAILWSLHAIRREVHNGD